MCYTYFYGFEMMCELMMQYHWIDVLCRTVEIDKFVSDNLVSREAEVKISDYFIDSFGCAILEDVQCIR